MMDTKAFKGKGSAAGASGLASLQSGLASITGDAGLRVLRRQLTELQRCVHLEMDGLVEASRVPGTAYLLVRHRPRQHAGPRGNWQLRWRFGVLDGHRHARWEDVATRLDSLPVSLARHFSRLARRAEELNLLDQLLQGSINRCTTFLQRHRQLRSRTRPVGHPVSSTRWQTADTFLEDEDHGH